jgi:hypothetical protein
MPASAMGAAGPLSPAAAAKAPGVAMPLRVGQTMVGVAAGAKPAPLAGAAQPAGGTLLGVARPGIAPLAPGELEDEPESDEPPPPDPPGYEPARELGATLGPSAIPQQLRALSPEKERDRKRRRVVAAAPDANRIKVRKDEERSSRRALALVYTAGALALVAVLVAVFWPSGPALVARVRADEKGREGIELRCKNCPDGTKLGLVTIAPSPSPAAPGSGDVTAVTTAGLAVVYPPTPLSVGDNPFKISIDRPGNGRDETVRVNVNVSHRIRPDLATLQADKPSFQIIAEVATGTTVTVDGRPMTIAGGRGVENVDISEACTGLADEAKTVSRQIPYVVTQPSGTREEGVVNVFVQIVPLRLDAPVALPTAGPGGLAPHVITDGPSFLLAGRTAKGASVMAAGRPLTVQPDGSFGQVMNVSSVGATQIEVRATMPGMAPRITQVKVRRVDSLEKAARDFAGAEPPVPFATLAANVPAAVGKPVVLTGEVSDTSKQKYETVMLLEVSAASGCGAGGACTVRLVQGGDNPAKRGDTVRVYGHVTRAFSVPGRPDIPEIEVDFTLKGDARDRK